MKWISPQLQQLHIKKIYKKFIPHLLKTTLWFSLGALLGFFFFISFLYIFYQKSHTNRIYSGVMVNGVDFSGKTKQDIESYFAEKNKRIQKSTIIFTSSQDTASISAKTIGFGYDESLLAEQALSVGRSSNILSDLSLMLQAYTHGINLLPAYHYAGDRLDSILAPLQERIMVKPVDAVFQFENGRVSAFRTSVDGQMVDIASVKNQLFSKLLAVALSDHPQIITLPLPIVTVKPNLTTDKANNLGIKELIAEGTSLFHHSIDNRIYNISLAASRINGALIPPGQVFSFDKTLGDVSSFTGYKQAYVIENGHTVLGDGGGVCQVSTTLFRAALNAGLPIVERNQHAYRVGYYEEDSPPGVDAAVYSPSVDLKFKNDTDHYILIQTTIDTDQQRLTFDLYGTKDDREVIVNQPVIVSETAAPPPLYQDDPTLPKGQVKQVDFAAGGANIYFTRIVNKNGQVYLSDKFISNYRPWQAVYLRGTKE